MASEYSIDAKGRSLGRVAAEAAKALMGKMSASYEPRLRPSVKVTIKNAAGVAIPEKKYAKEYQRYTGYPGGLRKKSLTAIVGKAGYRHILRLAITRMLPRNTQRTIRLKNLSIEE